MRIHLVTAAYVYAFSPFYHFTQTQYILITLTVGMVLSAEAVNTALEALVNLETQSYDNLARIAKDAAAGAVLICSVFAFAIGLVLYLKPPVIIAVVGFLVANPFWGMLFLVSLPICVAFIFDLPRFGTTIRKR